MTRTSFVAKCIKRHGSLDPPVTGSPMSSVMKRAIKKTADREARYPNNVAGCLPELFGAGLFEITGPLRLFLELNASVAVAAVTTALIGGAYVGFSAAYGKPHAFWSELGVAILFATAAVLEMLWHWFAPQLSLALHALWDVLHHKGTILRGSPDGTSHFASSTIA